MRRPSRLLARITSLSLAAFLIACESSTEPGGNPGDTITGVMVSVATNPVAMPTTVQATATVAPGTAAQSVTWATSDAARATIDASGLITPLLQGPVTITATSTVDVTRFGSVVLNVVCPDPRLVTSDVQEDTTWENWIPDPDCFDYVVQTSISMSEEVLIIEPGTTVGFESGRRLQVTGDAALVAEGTEDDPIRLTGTEEIPGHWWGLVFSDSQNEENVLDYVTVEYGGADDIGTLPGANLEIQGDSELAVSNSVFQHSSGYGLYASNGTVFDSFSGNTMTSNAEQGAYVSARVVGALGSGNDFSGNGIDEVRVETGTGHHLTASATWADHGVPYYLYFLSGLEFDVQGATLTLEPGVTLLMREGLGIVIEEGAHFEAVGTALNPITLDAKDADWRGIRFQDATGNIAEASIIGAGSESFGANERAAITITTVSTLDPPASTVTFGGNVILMGTDYEIAFGFGDTFASPCMGRVFLPGADTTGDHCN